MQSNDFNNTLWQQVFDATENKWHELTAPVTDEILLTVSEHQINDALYQFVTQNVDAILDMRIELHENWFRLFATVNAQGVFARVASDFNLVHVQLDRQRQRLVFAQIGDTDILELYSTSYLKSKGICFGVNAYRRLLKKDPLGLILNKINLARIKDNVMYIDIGRWLKKNQKIMDALYKFQINTAHTKNQQLILQAHINYRDLLVTNANSGDIITEADSPSAPKPNSQTNEQHTTDDDKDDEGLTQAPAPTPDVDINPVAKP